MGQQINRQKLISAIDKNNYDKVLLILQYKPQYLNMELSTDLKVTPLCRAVWRNDQQLAGMLLGVGAGINEGGSQLITPLMWAAKRDYPEMAQYLIEKGAQIELESQEGLNCLDYAILHGNYRVSIFLYTNYINQIKLIDVYQEMALEKDYRYVNYNIFLEDLIQKTEIEFVGDFFKRPPIKKLNDPVVDPNESWPHVIKRIANFDAPPLVEKESLPENQKPENNMWVKMKCKINGVPVNKSEKKQIDDTDKEKSPAQFKAYI